MKKYGYVLTGALAMVRKLQEQGIRIDGIGMQGHVGMDYPDISEFEKSIEAFASLGVKVMITELDITLISRVTLWGVNDAQSWRNNWPVRGRTDYPLLFDRDNRAKPVVSKIIEEALNS